MKTVLMITLVMAILSRKHHRKHKKKEDAASVDYKEMTAVEEMNMRARGTFVSNYVDQFDRTEPFNLTDPNVYGDENRDSAPDF